MKNGDTASIGAHEAAVIDVGGHTNGHIAYHLPEDGIAFVGDSVFALGCGRMFEGEPQQFWDSLSRIKALPPETMLYCAHEYTQSNARFALHADPDNLDSQLYAREIDDRRARNEPTVPTKLERELLTNPFLRADREDLRNRWGGDRAARDIRQAARGQGQLLNRGDPRVSRAHLLRPRADRRGRGARRGGAG